MLGQLLLATTLGLPSLMLATCLSARVRERMLALLVFAPLPAMAAALFAVDSQLLVGQGRLQLALQLMFSGRYYSVWRLYCGAWRACMLPAIYVVPPIVDALWSVG